MKEQHTWKHYAIFVKSQRWTLLILVEHFEFFVAEPLITRLFVNSSISREKSVEFWEFFSQALNKITNATGQTALDLKTENLLLTTESACCCFCNARKQQQLLGAAKLRALARHAPTQLLTASAVVVHRLDDFLTFFV